MIHRYPCLLFLFCALASFEAKAQNWQGIAPQSAAAFPVRCFYEDTTDNRLYIGGYTSNGFSYYDGTNLIPMGGNLWPVKQIIRYHDTLYASALASGTYLCKWNGTSWDTTGLSADGAILSLYIYNDELYAGGQFTSIGGVSANGIAKYNGSTWSDIGNISFGYNYGIAAITNYNGEIYIGGSFGSAPGVPVNILRWNGVQWDSVGGGIQGGEVWDFDIYGNELYIGGAFRVDNGGPGNYIAKWNGNAYSDVGGGVMGAGNGNGYILDLMIYDNYLYAVGAFVWAGGIPAGYIAKWDGTNWCGMGSDVQPGSLGTYNGDLYVGGGGWWIFGNDTIWAVAKWIGGNYVDTCGNMTGISESQVQSEVLVYPNPASDVVTFQFSGDQQSHELIIYDAFGKEAWRGETNESSLAISVQKFGQGIFFYSVIEENGASSKGKFLIQ